MMQMMKCSLFEVLQGAVGKERITTRRNVLGKHSGRGNGGLGVLKDTYKRKSVRKQQDM